MTELGGVPLITGAVFARPVTAIEKAGSDTDAVPSLTLIRMFAYVPTWADVGAPDRRPVLVLKDAQLGRFWMLNPNVLPSGSLAAGVKT